MVSVRIDFHLVKTVYTCMVVIFIEAVVKRSYPEHFEESGPNKNENKFDDPPVEK
jgi:hypothetical protein